MRESSSVACWAYTSHVQLLKALMDVNSQLNDWKNIQTENRLSPKEATPDNHHSTVSTLRLNRNGKQCPQELFN